MIYRKGLIIMTVCPGTKIKELRLLADMSQEELGRRVGVQRAAINKYEKGTVENIPLKTIEKIADVFEVSPNYIVGWDNVESNPLSAEIKVLQGVKRFYSNDAVELLECYTNLNSKGKQRVNQYAEDMVLIYSKVKKQIAIEVKSVPDIDLEELGFEKIKPEKVDLKDNIKI